MNKIFLMIAVSLLLVSFTNQAFAYDEKLAVLETNLGTIVIEFFHEDAPNHVDNFIGLAESGFYDGTIFHRIIPGFMIQGGDPNTISGDPSTWGQGGPTERVDAEFNTIKHNRGIVSMARSADPDSGGSQFFIIHKNSNFLDEQYTVFGRIATEESFETLDRIAGVEIGDRDRPIDTKQVKITKVIVVNRSEVSNLLEFSEPERTQSTITPSTGNQRFESSEYGIAFTVPEGWLLQQPEKTQENSPDVVAVGPKTGVINPVISFTVQQTNQRTFDEVISDQNEALTEAIDLGSLSIISHNLRTVDGNKAYVTNAEGYFSSNGEDVDIKFKQVLVYDTEKFYIFSYSNGVDEFDSQLPNFVETVNSFEILSKDSSGFLFEEQVEEGGGCLIATATFGSELAPQVQQLRELRDNTILSTESGIAFMAGFNQLYYSFSPTIADLEREYPVFKEVVKLSITPMLSTLSILNYAEIDSEQEMLSFGIGIILMNVGMYFVAPAIIIYKIRKQLIK
ncbi:MAG: peptidylprolyl isomerase [Nitrosopumilus sp.]